MRYKHPNDKKIILCAVTVFLCAVAFAASIVRICMGNDAPAILVFVLFVAAVGFSISLSFLVRSCKERAKDKRNGTVTQKQARQPLTAADKICIAAIVLSGAIIVVGIVFVCYPEIAPTPVALGLLIGGAVLYSASTFCARLLAVTAAKKQAEEKRLAEEENFLRNYDNDENNGEPSGAAESTGNVESGGGFVTDIESGEKSADEGNGSAEDGVGA